jgi:hypothetical protein
VGPAHLIILNKVISIQVPTPLINELFRLFAKELLAPRPFAMCLKMSKFYSIAEWN